MHFAAPGSFGACFATPPQPPATFGQMGAPQWFGMYERDSWGNWQFMGWLYTDFPAAQMFATHVEQCRVFMQQPELRYAITDTRGDGIIPAMRD